MVVPLCHCLTDITNLISTIKVNSIAQYYATVVAAIKSSIKSTPTELAQYINEADDIYGIKLIN